MLVKKLEENGSQTFIEFINDFGWAFQTKIESKMTNSSLIHQSCPVDFSQGAGAVEIIMA